jgi:N-methylhydantoinase B
MERPQFEFDPITLEVLQSSLQAISDEMFAAMRKTAMSAIIYEVLDMGTAITDADGNLAASGAGIPAFIGVLDKAVKRVLELHPVEDIRPGDVFITNDPYHGGVTHLNDAVLAMPVFAGDDIVAWTANIAHWNDVGGIVPGSMSNEASEIYQEGLRLPAVKLIIGGTPLRSVFDILKSNTRLPDFLEGDLWAGIAAVRLGERRIGELVGRYGEETFLAAIEHFMEYGERVSRNALRDLPKGRFTYEDEQDNGLLYRVTMEITDDEFIIDLRDNPDQDTGPSNLSRDGSLVHAQIIFKNITDPEGVANSGTFAPLKLLTRPGTVFDVSPPGANALYYVVGIALYDLLWRCLATHLPGRLPAGTNGSICATVVSGTHPDTGRPSTIIEPQVGGWGGAPDADGNSAQFSGTHGDTFNCPAEVAESRYGLYVDRLALNDEPGGEGTYRGGKGIVLEYRVRSDRTYMSCAFSRFKHPPWGLDGGLDGSPNYLEVVRTNGEREIHLVTTGLRLDEGDVIRVVSGNGGGWGDPSLRPAEAIADDIRNGYVTVERAREVYGEAVSTEIAPRTTRVNSSVARGTD